MCQSAEERKFAEPRRRLRRMTSMKNIEIRFIFVHNRTLTQHPATGNTETTKIKSNSKDTNTAQKQKEITKQQQQPNQT